MNTTEQLLQQINNLFPNTKCSLQDLRNPTEEFVTDFYLRFLQDFEVDVANLNHMQIQQQNVVGMYSDAFSSFILKGNLLRCIRSFDIIPDFGMLDITSPTPNRIQHILKAFIEFYSLSDVTVASLTNKQEIVKARKMKMQSKFKEKDEKKTHLNELVREFGNIQKEEKQLDEQILQLKQTAPEIKNKIQLVKTASAAAKEKLQEKEKALQKLNKEIASVTNKMKESVGLIVDSPSSFLSDMDSLREKASELEDLADQKRSMVEEKTQKDLKLQTYLSLVQDKIQVLNEVLDIFKLLKTESKTSSGVEKNIKACQEKLNELMRSHLALCNKKQMQQEVLQDSHLQWKTLEPQLTQNVTSCVRELQKKKDAKNKMISSLKDDTLLEEKKQEYIDYLQKLIKKFNKCVQQKDDLMKEYYQDIENYQVAEKENLKKIESDLENNRDM